MSVVASLNSEASKSDAAVGECDGDPLPASPHSQTVACGSKLSPVDTEGLRLRLRLRDILLLLLDRVRDRVRRTGGTGCGGSGGGSGGREMEATASAK